MDLDKATSDIIYKLRNVLLEVERATEEMAEQRTDLRSGPRSDESIQSDQEEDLSGLEKIEKAANKVVDFFRFMKPPSKTESDKSETPDSAGVKTDLRKKKFETEIKEPQPLEGDMNKDKFTYENEIQGNESMERGVSDQKSSPNGTSDNVQQLNKEVQRLEEDKKKLAQKNQSIKQELNHIMTSKTPGYLDSDRPYNDGRYSKYDTGLFNEKDRVACHCNITSIQDTNIGPVPYDSIPPQGTIKDPAFIHQTIGDTSTFIKYDPASQYVSQPDLCLCNANTKSKDSLEDQIKRFEDKIRRIQTDVSDAQRTRESVEEGEKYACRCYPFLPDSSHGIASPALQLRQLREQYKQLKDDYNKKVEEVSRLICESRRQKNMVKKIEADKKLIESQYELEQDRFRELERRVGSVKDSKDQLKELKQKLWESNTQQQSLEKEIKKVNETLKDQILELDEVKKKYLESKLETEEQKQIAIRIKMDNDILKEDLNMRINHIKQQYQKELEILQPLPNMLKNTQAKLREVMEIKSQIERQYYDTLRCLDEEKNSAQLLSRTQKYAGEVSSPLFDVEACKDMRLQNEDLKNKFINSQHQLEMKTQELLKADFHVKELTENMATLRSESARQVAEMREHVEMTKRILQGKILDMEANVAKSAAMVQTVKRDKETLRHRMQNQINFLSDNLSSAKKRIKELYGHISNDMTDSLPEFDKVDFTCNFSNCPNEYFTPAHSEDIQNVSCTPSTCHQKNSQSNKGIQEILAKAFISTSHDQLSCTPSTCYQKTAPIYKGIQDMLANSLIKTQKDSLSCSRKDCPNI
uniref:Uncharacterized protein n=1 Tax=Timema poppense TaxID=170557 RepID=A0A7R9D7M8_TIMPO|nr:unnamed protein product [Timema poppensis]